MKKSIKITHTAIYGRIDLANIGDLSHTPSTANIAADASNG